MLHIFSVNQGRIISLDVSLVTGSVRQLQSHLQGETAVPVALQVLLVSGGEVLEPSKFVSSYPGAGTDSNPIFLVCRSPESVPNILVQSQETGDLDSCSRSLRDHAQALANQNPSFETLQQYEEIAKEYAVLNERSVEICRRLVQDQHLLHQGWLALVSNLEDTVAALARRTDRVKAQFDRLLALKENARDLLNVFEQDLRLLSQIPVPVCLLNAESGRMEQRRDISLLDWISDKDPDRSLHELAQEVQNLLEQIDANVWQSLEQHRKEAEKSANNKEMKEIRGITVRFQQLDKHLGIVETTSVDQKLWVDQIKAQYDRALERARDPETMKELCRVQRDSMSRCVEIQDTLTTIAKQLASSKTEVLNNVQTRLTKWIVKTHQLLHIGSNKLHENWEKLSALKKRMDVLKQVHDAPTIYATAICEVLRRKSFSEDFLNWSSQVVEKSQKLHQEESDIRDGIESKLSRHFLKSLFPGISDQLPEFATKHPTPFDQNLPQIEAAHLRALRESAPSLEALLRVSMPRLFDRLAVCDPRAFVGMSRVDSFCTSGTPPRNLFGAKSFPSTAWLSSGDENLDFSPSSNPLLMRSPYSRLDLTAMGFQKLSSDSEQQEDLCPTLVPADAEPSASYSARSAPIRIPSRAPSDGMSVSRQLSEKSSRFGTPEEDIIADGSGDLATSPPEMISRSELNKEIGALAEQMVAQVAGMGEKSPEIGSSIEQEGIVFEAGQDDGPQTTVASPQTDASIQVSQLEQSTQLLETEAALDVATERVTTLEQICRKQQTDFVQQLNVFKEELSNLRSLVEETCSASNDRVGNVKSVVDRSAHNLEEQMQQNMSKTLEAAIELQTNDFEMKLHDLQHQLEISRQEASDADRHLSNYESLVRQKDGVVAGLEEQLTSSEQHWVQKIEEAKSEIIKQLTIEYELQIDDQTQNFRRQIQARETEMQDMKDQMREKNAVITQLHQERDEYFAQMYDRTPQAQLESLKSEMEAQQMRHDNELKTLRSDLEKEFKDKLQFLTKGMEDKHNESIVRVHKENEIEMRIVKEQYDRDLETLREEHLLELSQLRNKLEQTRTPSDGSIGQAPDSENDKLSAEEPAAAGSSGSEQAMGHNLMDESTMQIASEMEASVATSSMAESVCPTHSLTTKNTQTRLRSKDIRSMISVSEISEGSAVLVVYDESHASFVLFSTSNTLYFVKERSVNQLALWTPEGLPRKNWVLARVLKTEYCQIKKIDNRYKLPLQTRFYRVELEKMPERVAPPDATS